MTASGTRNRRSTCVGSFSTPHTRSTHLRSQSHQAHQLLTFVLSYWPLDSSEAVRTPACGRGEVRNRWAEYTEWCGQRRGSTTRFRREKLLVLTQ